MKFINLKQFRQDRSLSQKELVAITGLPQSTVSYIENGYQEIRDNQLAMLKKAFPGTDFSLYFYESDSYPYLTHARRHQIEMKRTFPGDWSRPAPVDNTEGVDILLKMGRASVSFEGDILLDRNDGTFQSFGIYVIKPILLENSQLVNLLTKEKWFDDELYEDFKRCYLIACRLAGKQPVNQIKVEY